MDQIRNIFSPYVFFVFCFCLSACGSEVDLYQWYAISGQAVDQNENVLDSIEETSTDDFKIKVKMAYSKLGKYRSSITGPPASSHYHSAQFIDTLYLYASYSDGRTDSLLNSSIQIFTDEYPQEIYDWMNSFGKSTAHIPDSFYIVPNSDIPTGTQRFYIELQTGQGKKTMSDSTAWVKLN